MGKKNLTTNYPPPPHTHKKQTPRQSVHLLQIPLCSDHYRYFFFFFLLFFSCCSPLPIKIIKAVLKQSLSLAVSFLQMKVNSHLSKHCEWQVAYQSRKDILQLIYHEQNTMSPCKPLSVTMLRKLQQQYFSGYICSRECRNYKKITGTQI